MFDRYAITTGDDVKKGDGGRDGSPLKRLRGENAEREGITGRSDLVTS